MDSPSLSVSLSPRRPSVLFIISPSSSNSSPPSVTRRPSSLISRLSLPHSSPSCSHRPLYFSCRSINRRRFIEPFELTPPRCSPPHSPFIHCHFLKQRPSFTRRRPSRRPIPTVRSLCSAPPPLLRQSSLLLAVLNPAEQSVATWNHSAGEK